MNTAARLLTPVTPALGTLPLALLLAASIIALMIAGVYLVILRRTSRLNALAGWLSGAGAVAILASALLVGGALTQSPTAVADPAPATPRGASGPYSASQLDGTQLPTLAYDAPGSTP
ncbi:hypothetical protein [Galbitalea soli]|uniref:Uncharacterized protein n=1 Tax=Galbitalea soli TaxID=1268042 RepID=A0A7C9PKF1_9MICO|nr:hypothetical protein [Galbitalea soli]NEM89813.1 hypothetical protein [Galbitalea soli]NYJ30517.1 hypothetical protein [Galbitalea soli]